LTTLTKDVFYGKEVITLVRIFVSDRDFADLLNNNTNKLIFWSVVTSDSENLHIDFSRNNIPATTGSSRGDLFTTYYVDHISSILFVLAAAMMMIIALVLLQFAIRITVEEDFREIGVMKAIGVKNVYISRIYMVKYLALTFAGTAAGFVLSFPFGDFLAAPLKESIVMPGGQFGFGLLTRILCSFAVVGFIMIFCRRATKHVGKISVIQAIRKGQGGRRFHRIRRKLRGAGTRIALFMAGNDVLLGPRDYISFFLALALGMMMIIVTSNIAATLRSGNTLEYCGWFKADAYADAPAGFMNLPDKTYPELRATLADIEREFAAKGIRVEADAFIALTPRIYKDNKEEGIPVTGFTRVTDKPVDVPYFEGDGPKLANEISVTDALMDALAVHIGDTVMLDFGHEEKEYIITGKTQTMGPFGRVNFAPADEPNLLYAYATLAMLFDFADRGDIPGQIERAKEVFPQYNIGNPEERLRTILGGTIDIMNGLAVSLFFVLLTIICLVAFLISHTLLAKDKPAIVLLKSIGFPETVLKVWQTLRMLLVAAIGIVFGVLISFPVTLLTTKMAFGIFGADRVPPQCDVLWAFIICPVSTVTGVLLISALVSLGIGRISTRKSENQEQMERL